jgi:ubiquinone/menaquinone biosynthesis C-methylase UbiE
LPFGSFTYLDAKSLPVKLARFLYGEMHIVSRIRASIVFKWLNKDFEGLILDGGCGSGLFALTLAMKNRDVSVIAIDISVSDIRRAKFYSDKLKLNNVSFIIADVTHLPFRNNVFDGALYLEILEHIQDDEEAIEELGEVLKEKGFLILSTPSEYFPYDPKLFGHVRRGYTIDYLKNFLSSNSLHIANYEYYVKFFGKIAIRLTDTTINRIVREHMYLLGLIFPLAYMISKLDFFLPHKKGLELIVKAIKSYR